MSNVSATKARGRVGRPPVYQPDFARRAKGYAVAGFSDRKIAEFLGVTPAAVAQWKTAHPAFLNALQAGRDSIVHAAVALSKRAKGYTRRAEKQWCYEGEIVRAEVVEYYPPDVRAIEMLLKHRAPHLWGDEAQKRRDDKREARKAAAAEKAQSAQHSEVAQGAIAALERLAAGKAASAE